MYYLTEEDNQVRIYAFPPETPYVELEQLPKYPAEQDGYYVKLRIDIEAGTAWYEHVELPPPEPMPEPEPQPTLTELKAQVDDLQGAFNIIAEGVLGSE